MEIGYQIQQQRLALGWTQAELATALHVSRATVSNWETGRNYPDIALIVQLSTVLGLSLDELLKGDRPVVQKISADTRRQQGHHRNLLVVSLSVLLLLIIVVGLYWSSLGPQVEDDPTRITSTRVDRRIAGEVYLDINTNHGPWWSAYSVLPTTDLTLQQAAKQSVVKLQLSYRPQLTWKRHDQIGIEISQYTKATAVHFLDGQGRVYKIVRLQ